MPMLRPHTMSIESALSPVSAVLLDLPAKADAPVDWITQLSQHLFFPANNSSALRAQAILSWSGMAYPGPVMPLQTWLSTYPCQNNSGPTTVSASGWAEATI